MVIKKVMRISCLSLIIIFNVSTVFSQNSQKDDWIRVFWEPEVTIPFDLLETYDHGYLIDATIRPEYYSEIWTWIIKTDINGNVLWEKKIGDGIHGANLHDIAQTEDGGYILSGGTTLLDNVGDIFFMKLDACGNKEWCKIFHTYTQYVMPFALAVYPLEDGSGYISLSPRWEDLVPGSGIYKNIWLMRLDNEGGMEWAKDVFTDVDTNVFQPTTKEMLLSKKKIAGDAQEVVIITWTYYFDYGGLWGWGKPFICRADVNGNELWWSVHGKNQEKYGEAYNGYEDSKGNIYSLGYYQYKDSTAYHPALFKNDMYGNVIYDKFIDPSTLEAKSFCMNEINDTLLDIGGVWSYTGGDDGIMGIMRTDTNGNLIMEKTVFEPTIYGLARCIKTFDNKELFIGMLKYDDGKYTKYKTVLHKFNENLEYDTIYTQPMEYDYMCDDLPILSDTIDICDCDIWTMLPPEQEYQISKVLTVYPNPATTEITVLLPRYTADKHKWGPMTSIQYNAKYYKYSKLVIYDIYGRQVKTLPLEKVTDEKITIDIGTFNQGIYMINLYEKNRKMAGGKFIVNR